MQPSYCKMNDCKLTALIVASAISFMFFSTFATIFLILYGPHKINDSPSKNGTIDPDTNFIITYSDEEGLVITIHNNIAKTALKGYITMHRGHRTGSRIRLCDIGAAGAIGGIGKKVEHFESPELDNGYIDFNDPSFREDGTCIEMDGKGQYKVEPLTYIDTDIECQSHRWQASDCREDTFSVCFDMSDSHWYGGAQVREQLWPIEKWVTTSMPYVTGDSFKGEYGGVQERYWFSSTGMAIFVDWNVPLWVAINETGNNDLCLKASYINSTYNNIDHEKPLFMNYTICEGTNVKHIHQFMINNYIGKPSGIPDEDLFRYPIWSTWANFFKDINQSIVLNYAQEITDYGFSHAQLEIDDKWEVNYGDLDFDYDKFPNPKAMTDELYDMGFRTTLWVHPFIDYYSSKMLISSVRLSTVKDPGGLLPALTTWWNGVGATLDITQTATANWFKNQLKDLQDEYGISSFKFDAGESNWLPAAYTLAAEYTNPSDYSTHYAELASSIDHDTRNLEIRVGARTQHLPIFVRMMDKVSTWSYNNGLKSVIPHALTFSLIGYPFILPDMIGGNAYDDIVPDKELFIRWVELNVFLPGFQFSIPPWDFDEETIEISLKMMELHTQYSDYMIDLARECILTGDPIIRPLWWADPYDETALIIDTEYLLGDLILVAPIVESGARMRDIYFPSGLWEDVLRGGTINGRQWVYNYTVNIDEIAYFNKVVNEHWDVT